METEKGHVVLHLDELLAKKNISKLQFCTMADLTLNQVAAYSKNKRKKLDKHILARMCHVLDCDLDDLIEYVLPK